MDRGSVLSGAPFKSAVLGAGLILLLLVATGGIGFRAVQTAMLGALGRQLTEEQMLLADFYRQGGEAGLVRAVGEMGGGIEPRVLGVFDASGRRLAGNLAVAPDFEGQRRARLTLRPGGEAEPYYVSVAALDGLRIEVGRSLAPVLAAEKALAGLLAVLGVVLTGAVMAIGYRFSAQSNRKLVAIGAALDRVAGGEMAARLPVGAGNDQIDRIARQINGHLDRLSSLMSSTRATAAAIAHDLKTPLSRAFLALQSARDRIGRGEPAEAALKETERDLDEMNAIFDAILRVARVEAGPLPQAAPVIDLVPVVADVAETLGAVAEEAGRRLLLETEPGARALTRADARLVGQMVVNLVQNAIVHGPPGTTIRVRAGFDASPFIQVADDGPGIPEARRATVLDPFVRLDEARSTRGSGLGLTLVRAIAGHHGAELRLEDAGPGLRVTVRFPAL